MRKIKLTGDKYIAELNNQLKQHEYFEEGMKFSAHPEGATGKDVEGYSISGPPDKIGVYAYVAHNVSNHYDWKDA